jgi:hypothetical protein
MQPRRTPPDAAGRGGVVERLLQSGGGGVVERLLQSGGGVGETKWGRRSKSGVGEAVNREWVRLTCGSSRVGGR